MIWDLWSEICDLRSETWGQEILHGKMIVMNTVDIYGSEDLGIRGSLHRAWDQRFLWSCLPILFLQNDSIDSSSSSDTGESNSHKIRRMRPRPHFKGGQRQSQSGRKLSTPAVSTNYSMTCLERLIRTHPIWFLPKINRDEASEFLAGKESGVRKYAIC